MPRRRQVPLSEREVPERVRSLVRENVVIVLGSPVEVLNLLDQLEVPKVLCYQMDLYQAERLTAVLQEHGHDVEVAVAPDLWDLPADFQTALYLPALGGERELKIDMVEQAYHVLRPRGNLVVWSPHDEERFFPQLLKKVFGKAHADQDVSVLWAHQEKERPRRRHQVTFQARIGDNPRCEFVSRPGTFSYGKLDDGARALAEVMEIEPGDRVLDLGCGIGTNGIFASQRAGPDGHIAFVDSNVRATALADLNATANGLQRFEALASSKVEGLPEESFNVIVANPPYHAGGAIGRMFIDRARELLTPQGRFFLVTRQPDQVLEVLQETFGEVEAFLHRGYTVFRA